MSEEQTSDSSLGSEETTDTVFSRRRLLKSLGGVSGAIVIGSTLFTGVASANRVSTIAFCGCSQVVVYGEDLDDATYRALLYCGDPPDGEVDCAELTGDATRKNYEVSSDDCKIIAVIGRTNPEGEEREQSFSVCNEHGPQECATKALADVRSREDELINCLVDAASTNVKDTLTIQRVNDGPNAKYEFTVGGSLSSGGNLESGDKINGTTATGVVGSGDDTYLYEGDITSFEFTSETTTDVVINEQQVNLTCGTDLERLGITVRSGGCGPENPGGGPSRDRGKSGRGGNRGR